MINFKTPELSDRHWVDELFFARNNRGCEYSFTVLYCWKDAYEQKIARVNDYAVQFLSGSLGPCYPFPVGKGELKPVIDVMMEDAEERGEPFRLICATHEDLAQLEDLYPGRFEFSEDRHGFDYLYQIDRLADLKGKKLHGKRNHIHRFEENYPDWRAERVTSENMDECRAMEDEWTRLSMETKDEESTSSLPEEREAMRLTMQDFDALGEEGLLIRAGGRVIAFTLGRKLSEDTYDVHFEKAYGDIQGAYPIVNREFARQIRTDHPEIVYLNREDDMGLEGLRKAKESYYPDLMVEKYTAILKE